MKAFLEVVEFNVEDVVTTSVEEPCAADIPCIEGGCAEPGID